MAPADEIRPPFPEITAHWCPRCGAYREPFSGPVPKTRHWTKGEMCKAQFVAVRYVIKEIEE